MDTALPSWFQADNVFPHNGKWFYGSEFGLHVGPYGDRTLARQKGLEAAVRVGAARTDGERLRFVRDLLREEWDTISRECGDAEMLIVAPIDIEPPAMQVRTGETEKSWFRSDRFFQVDGVWFFSTREGIDVGPFDSLDDAKRHEQSLLRLVVKARTPEQAHRVIYEYKHSSAVEKSAPTRVRTSPVRQFRRVH